MSLDSEINQLVYYNMVSKVYFYSKYIVLIKGIPVYKVKVKLDSNYKQEARRCE